MKEWKDDKALFALIKEELYTAVKTDVKTTRFQILYHSSI